MDYRVTFKKSWKYRDRKRGLTEIAAGSYNVPEQVSDAAARLAVAQGMASTYVPQMPARPKAEPTETEQQPTTPRRKGRAPKNKSRGAAPENKTTLV